MSFERTYAHTLLIALDDLGAAILFNRDDLCVSSLCGLQRRADSGDVPALAAVLSLGLRPWQASLLRRIGAGLEWLSPGHCEASIAGDIERGDAMRSLLGAAGNACSARP